jgi:hypothetical protein
MTDVTPGLQDIVEALSLADLPDEEREQILLDIQELVFKSTMVRLVDRMDDATRADFTTLMERDAGEEEVEEFLKTRVIDADGAVAEAVQDLTDDILAVTKD